jgi:hypothetical protein
MLMIDSPNERILVIYRAEHLAWLRQDIANDHTVQLRTLDEFAPKSRCFAYLRNYEEMNRGRT